MATKKVYDLAVAVGSYTDAQGQTRNRYQNIGAVMQKDDGGKFIIMERWFNPAGVPYDSSRGNSILLSMFEPRQQQGGGGQGSAAGTTPGDDDDHIPF
jgi:hypothetical protein